MYTTLTLTRITFRLDASVAIKRKGHWLISQILEFAHNLESCIKVFS